MKPQDLKELALTLKFEKCNAGEKVFEYASIGSTFYIILKGTCTVWIPNKSVIKDWNDSYRHYKKLLAWKENEHDPKLEEAKRVHEEEQKALHKQPIQVKSQKSNKQLKWA
jgi:hypothetical protein